MQKPHRTIDWVVAAMVGAMLILIFTWMLVIKDLPPSGQTLGSVAVGVVLIFVGVIENVRRDRRRDEVQLAASRFGTRWALLASITLAVGAAFVPAAQSLLIRVGEALSESNPALPATVGMFVVGVSLSIVVQQLAAQALSLAWTLSRR
jgi:hypothetical protein